MSADAMAGDAWWRAVDDGLVVQVRVTPGASRSGVVGVRDGRLAVRVRGRAVEGQANAALIETLANAFGVRPRAVTIAAGEHHRSKTVHVAGILAPPAHLGGLERPEELSSIDAAPRRWPIGSTAWRSRRRPT